MAEYTTIGKVRVKVEPEFVGDGLDALVERIADRVVEKINERTRTTIQVAPRDSAGYVW